MLARMWRRFDRQRHARAYRRGHTRRPVGVVPEFSSIFKVPQNRKRAIGPSKALNRPR
jgi:hypothetical protein